MKLRELKWQNPNLKDWNEKMWNLEGEFCILAFKNYAAKYPYFETI